MFCSWKIRICVTECHEYDVTTKHNMKLTFNCEQFILVVKWISWKSKLLDIKALIQKWYLKYAKYFVHTVHYISQVHYIAQVHYISQVHYITHR